MTPATHARVALRGLFMVTELLAELELAPGPLEADRSHALTCTINAGAALERLVTTLRGLERRANGRPRRVAKVATGRSRSAPRKKRVSVEKKGARARGVAANE